MFRRSKSLWFYMWHFCKGILFSWATIIKETEAVLIKHEEILSINLLSWLSWVNKSQFQLIPKGSQCKRPYMNASCLQETNQQKQRWFWQYGLIHGVSGKLRYLYPSWLISGEEYTSREACGMLQHVKKGLVIRR